MGGYPRFLVWTWPARTQHYFENLQSSHRKLRRYVIFPNNHITQKCILIDDLGHYGPAFYSYFSAQNDAIGNGSAKGVHLNFNSLTIINGIIDEYTQAPYYPEFAVNNTYGIVAYNDSVLDYVEMALNNPNGCLAQIEYCYLANTSDIVGMAVCTEAENMCRDNVEGPYYVYSGRGVYDIRHPYDDPTPPNYIIPYLNQASVQNALGVDTNYTEYSNTDVYYAFQQTGDFVYPNFLEDLEEILDSGVRVSLIYGDADYIW